MNRFEREPALAEDTTTEDSLQLAKREISRLRALVSTLEQTLETESRIRLEVGAMLASEQMRARELQEQLDAVPPPRRPETGPGRGTRRWWERPHPS